MQNPEIIACSKTITIHNIQNRIPVAVYTHHRGLINSVSITHNNKVIASCGQDGKIILANPQQTENKLAEYSFYGQKQKNSAVTTCLFSPNSHYLAAGSTDSMIKIWNIKESKKNPVPIQIKSHLGAITSLAWLKNLKNIKADSEILFSASSSADIYLHQNKNGNFNEIAALKAQEGINSITISQGQEYCKLAACTVGGSLSMWDLLSGSDRPFWTTQSNNRAPLTSLSISPFKPVLLVTSSADENLLFYDIHQKKLVKNISTEQPITAVNLHANGHTLIAGGMYGGYFEYDLRKPQKYKQKLTGHDTTIKHIEFYKSNDRQIGNRQTTKITKSNSISQQNQTNYRQGIRGASNLPSQIQKQTILQNKNVNEEIKNRQTYKPTQEPKINNFMKQTILKSTINPPSYISSINNEPKDKREIQEVKLTNTGQQVIRNAQLQKNLQKQSQMSNHFSQSSSSDFYKSKNKDSNRYMQNAHNPNISNTNDLNQSLQKQMKEMRQDLQDVEKRMKKQFQTDLYDTEERLTMSLIRQFQIHQQEMRNMMQVMVDRDKQKDEKIKQLQAELKRFKNNTI